MTTEGTHYYVSAHHNCLGVWEIQRVHRSARTAIEYSERENAKLGGVTRAIIPWLIVAKTRPAKGDDLDVYYKCQRYYAYNDSWESRDGIPV